MWINISRAGYMTSLPVANNNLLARTALTNTLIEAMLVVAYLDGLESQKVDGIAVHNAGPGSK